MLVFDLDETLVHVNRGPNFKKSDYFVKVKKPNGTMVTVGFTVRPKCREILEKLKENFNIVLMTASVKEYAEKVREILDPENNIFQSFLTKSYCLYLNTGKSIKDLSIYEGVDLKDIILIDNFASAYALNIDNGVPILPFYGVSTKNDKELPKLADFLIDLKDLEDVRVAIKQIFKTRIILESGNIMDYLEKIRNCFK